MNSRRKKPAARQDVDWQHREGRNLEGEKFSNEILVHGSGRILAKVFGPSTHDEYCYRATFCCPVPNVKPEETFDFIDPDSAKAFIDQTIGRFDPTPQPKAKKATTVRRKKTA